MYKYCIYKMAATDIANTKYPVHVGTSDFVFDRNTFNSYSATKEVTEEELRRLFTNQIDTSALKGTSSDVGIIIFPTFIAQTITKLTSDAAGVANIPINRYIYDDYTAFMFQGYMNSVMYIK